MDEDRGHTEGVCQECRGKGHAPGLPEVVAMHTCNSLNGSVAYDLVTEATGDVQYASAIGVLQDHQPETRQNTQHATDAVNLDKSDCDVYESLHSSNRRSGEHVR